MEFELVWLDAASRIRTEIRDPEIPWHRGPFKGIRKEGGNCSRHNEFGLDCHDRHDIC